MPAQRIDLSPYVVHLTRDYNGSSAADNLVSILASHCIEARTPLGIAVRHLESIGCGAGDFMESQKVACFSETPLKSLHGLIDPGIWRQNHFRAYGVAFTRSRMLYYGATPVWYINQYRGSGFRWLVHDVNNLIDASALENGKPAPEKWIRSSIARLTPFMESIGQWGTKSKDFAFEREWRFKGQFTFGWTDVAAVIVPPGKAEGVKQSLKEALRYPAYVDTWEFRELAEPDATE
ncbi:MAG TPA: abortive infection system antitoxin AbiGi family protein [Gemmatimonadaceae bacterium]